MYRGQFQTRQDWNWRVIWFAEIVVLMNQTLEVENLVERAA